MGVNYARMKHMDGLEKELHKLNGTVTVPSQVLKVSFI